MRTEMTMTTTQRRGATLLLLALAAVAGCGDGPTGPRPVAETVFAQQLGIALSQFTELASGVYVRDVTAGTGDGVATGQRAFLVIEGWLPTGASFQPMAQFDFTIGDGRVIPGFEAGIVGGTAAVGSAAAVDALRVGGTRIFILPASLAYGDSVLVFRVRLVSIGAAG